MRALTTSALGDGGDEATAEIPAAPGAPMPPKRRISRRVIIVAVVVVVAVGGSLLGLWLSSGSSTPAFSVTTQTVSVTTGTIKQTVSASGTIEPAEQADLNFGVSGQVTAVNVKVGDVVTAGQALATVSTTALQADLDAAQATLASAEAKLSADESASASAATIDSDEASVTSAQSQLTSAQTSFADATLTSTIAGTVASVDLTVGQQVSGSGGSSSGSGASGSSAASGSSGASGATGSGATSGSGTGSTSSASSSSTSSSGTSGQIVVVSTSSYIVSATVDDTEVSQIAAGDQAIITPSGATTPVYGTVSTVGIIASESSGVASFPVTIAITGSPSGLYPGATATVAIIVKQLNDVVEVPTTAITYSSSGNATVQVQKNGQTTTRAVTVGQSASGETQITGGVVAGDRVLERVVHINAGVGRTFGSGGFSGGGGFGGGGFTGGGGLTGGGAG